MDLDLNFDPGESVFIQVILNEDALGRRHVRGATPVRIKEVFYFQENLNLYIPRCFQRITWKVNYHFPIRPFNPADRSS